MSDENKKSYEYTLRQIQQNDHYHASHVDDVTEEVGFDYVEIPRHTNKNLKTPSLKSKMTNMNNDEFEYKIPTSEKGWLNMREDLWYDARHKNSTSSKNTQNKNAKSETKNS
jgi:hypothetical protein